MYTVQTKTLRLVLNIRKQLLDKGLQPSVTNRGSTAKLMSKKLMKPSPAFVP